MNIPKSFQLLEKWVVLEQAYDHVEAKKILVAIDLDRNFDEANLNVLPAKILLANTLQEEYSIRNYNIILGEVTEIC